ncbi:MAG: nuclease A inhibitor family protein [Pyrinomonadaceae bacterium]
MGKSNEEIVESLSRAAAGLLFMSESDYPFEVIQWEGSKGLTPDFIRSLTDEAEDCPVQELEVEDFLSAGRYQRLLMTLQSQLSNLKAYKVGRINMPVYLVGRSSEGSWLGLSTRVVET